MIEYLRCMEDKLHTYADQQNMLAQVCHLWAKLV